MIYHIVRLKRCVFIVICQIDTPEAFENRSIDRPVDQSAGNRELFQVSESRMRISGCVGLLRVADNHTGTPRIATEKPVAHSGFYFDEGRVAGQFVIQAALGDESHRQVIGTPYKRNAVHKRVILGPLFYPLQSAAQVADEFLFDSRIFVLLRQMKVS